MNSLTMASRDLLLVSPACIQTKQEENQMLVFSLPSRALRTL